MDVQDRIDARLDRLDALRGDLIRVALAIHGHERTNAGTASRV
jgi:hypothetical protein